MAAGGAGAGADCAAYDMRWDGMIYDDDDDDDDHDHHHHHHRHHLMPDSDSAPKMMPQDGFGARIDARIAKRWYDLWLDIWYALYDISFLIYEMIG